MTDEGAALACGLTSARLFVHLTPAEGTFISSLIYFFFFFFPAKPHFTHVPVMKDTQGCCPPTSPGSSFIFIKANFQQVLLDFPTRCCSRCHGEHKRAEIKGPPFITTIFGGFVLHLSDQKGTKSVFWAWLEPQPHTQGGVAGRRTCSTGVEHPKEMSRLYYT